MADFQPGYPTGWTKLGPALNNFCILLNPLLFYITAKSKCQVLDCQGSWEQIINNILEISQVSSFKIAGNGPWTTIVLRFHECMADASVSPIHRSTPQSCYRRKPPIQMWMDRERMEQHRILSAEKIVHENNSSR